VDPDFPPCFESLWGFGKAPAHYSKTEWGQYKWKRAVEIFKGPFTVYDDPIDPNDIMQGRLGDCYFLSAICAIAEWQKRVKTLFLTRKVTPEGIFCVALCVNGMWEEVIMDDYFPVTDRGNHYTPAFNRSKKDNLWVMLLEKAWAKVHGGYLNINSGLTREALHDLTGAPSMTFFNDEGTDDERWNMIYDGDRNDFIMAAGTKDLSGQGRDFYEEKTGIVGSHAYSMIGCAEIVQEGSEYRVLKNYEKAQGKNVTRLVNLRNPWGKGEWKGEWCSTDKRWTPALRNTLNLTSNDDGLFYMPFESFVQLFSDFQICYYHDSYKYASTRLATEKNQHIYFKFQVNQPGDYYFTMNQQNKRFFTDDLGYKYSSCTMT
jgi:hypothetical protein